MISKLIHHMLSKLHVVVPQNIQLVLVGIWYDIFLKSALYVYSVLSFCLFRNFYIQLHRHQSHLLLKCIDFCKPASCPVIDLVCRRVDLSVRWHVHEMACQRFDCQRFGLSAACPVPTS